MTIPTWFLRELHREFDGRLRIRFSVARQAFHIEQKVERAILAPFRISDRDDANIRANEGYAFVMEVRSGDRMPCDKCNSTLHVPLFKTSDIRCRCGFRMRAAYYPLNDSLLDHLRSIDPHRDRTRTNVTAIDVANGAMERTRLRNIHNIVEAATLDDKYQLFQTPFSGYTGREQFQPSKAAF